MANVIHRTTLEFRPSVNEPDFPEPTWKWNPEMSGVAGVPSHYWKAPADWNAAGAGPVEMSQAEKDAVDQLLDIAGQTPKQVRLALKLAATTRNNNTTMSADPDLTFPVYPNEAYLFRGVVWFNTTAAADFKFTLLGPASPQSVIIKRHVVLPGATAYSNIGITTAFGGGGIAATGTGAGNGIVEFHGGVTVNSAAGDVAFSWAQNTSDAGPTSVLRGSYLEWARVA